MNWPETSTLQINIKCFRKNKFKKMKKILTNLLLLVPLAGFAQVPFTIKGKLQNPGEKAIVYLSYEANRGGLPVTDSVKIKNGEFAFSGKVNEVRMGRLTIAHQAESLFKLKGADFAVVLLTGDIDISNADSLIHATIKGNQLENDFIAIGKLKAAQEERRSKLWFGYQATPKAMRDDKTFGEQYEKVSNEAKANNRNLDFAYIKTHPSSYLSVMLLLNHATGEPLDTVSNAYKSVDASVRSRAAGKIVAGILDRRMAILIGGHAPEFSIPDATGSPVTLSSYKGKYVLVDFWASWCKPCRAESPYLVKAYDEYKDKNFTIVSISLDRAEDKQKWLQAIKTDHTERWAQLSDGLANRSPVSSIYHLDLIPQNVLIDPHGVIVGKNLRGEDLQKKLSEVIHN
jgi:peroxiredoxin